MGEKKKEAHRALYRKYRSKSLDEIIGQEHITTSLKNAVKNNTLSHAYLFTGPRGVGKTSIARILAHEINNIAYTDDSAHLDIIEIDAASNRRIDDIRDLREKVNLAPVNAAYKVYIIDEVHMLTPESFNALLKTLEEPPAHVIFILATTEVHKLPATIVSRTQRHTFRAVPIPQVTAHLKAIAKSEGIKVEDDALTLLAEHGEGSFRDSISLLDQISHLPQPVSKAVVEDLLGLAPGDGLAEVLVGARRGDTGQCLEKIHTLQESGVSPTRIADQLIALLRSAVNDGSTLNLIRNLLSVSASIQPGLSLDIAIIEYCLSHKASSSPANTPSSPVLVVQERKTAPVVKLPKQTTAPTKSKPKEVSLVQAKEDALEKKENIQTSKKVTNEESSIEDDDWRDILSEVKERNSSLYTVMRLAHTALEGDTCILSFQFPFHQKRADETKNKQLISEIISNQIGFQPKIVTRIDTELKRKEITSTAETPEPDSAHASLITNIQDMMGGGEIVDARNT